MIKLMLFDVCVALQFIFWAEIVSYNPLYTQKKLRKFCLRGYDKRSKTFTDF